MRRFEIVGQITEIETIATGSSIRMIEYLRDRYGPGNWRKREGRATVRYSDGTMLDAEVHWYEAHGGGRRGMKSQTRFGVLSGYEHKIRRLY